MEHYGPPAVEFDEYVEEADTWCHACISKFIADETVQKTQLPGRLSNYPTVWDVLRYISEMADTDSLSGQPKCVWWWFICIPPEDCHAADEIMVPFKEKSHAWTTSQMSAV